MYIPKFDNKPFKPPKKINSNGTLAVSSTNLKAVNSRKALLENSNLYKKPKLTDGIRNKAPELSNCGNSQTVQHGSDILYIYSMVLRKVTKKKHKTWSDDGYAAYRSSNKISFYDSSGSFLTSAQCTCAVDEICENIFKVGSTEYGIDDQLTDEEELDRVRKLLSPSLTAPLRKVIDNSNKLLSEKKTTEKLSTHVPISQLFSPKSVAKFKLVAKKQAELTESTISQSGTVVEKPTFSPVFDVTKIENPIVMNKGPNALVDVIVDPFIGKHLRQHQREGVRFMYECIMGLCRTEATNVTDTSKAQLLEHDSDIQGCLLADEMGLGKTLMTITLIWTLLKQTAYPEKSFCSQIGVPLHGLMKKILIVCPVTLIGNWKREFNKWLTLSRIGVLVLNPKNSSDKDKNDVSNFLKVQRTFQVLIIGYEKLLSVSEIIRAGKNNIGLLVCDEGHRLKNGSSKILNTLKSFDIKHKILLSGTPIQNDLEEFFTIIDFINPGVMGSYNHFKKRYIVPISKARDTTNRNNEKVRETGEERSNEIIEITKKFILRRTNEILAKYLPPKTDVVLFCKPTDTQIAAFKNVLQKSNVDFNTLNYSSSLGLITLFKKICNSPALIETDSYYNDTIRKTNLSMKFSNKIDSGKLRVLMATLKSIKSDTENEKVVIVSNYTQTLDIIENLMKSASMSFCRLDGSTPNKMRDSIVSSFNRSPNIFGFLLSAKSGGVGLNLVGASRLILFDNDWNPSVDLQAMSRIHRDGQTKPCFIYRLITTGCIDEKIFQRQLMKHNLSKKFLDSSGDGDSSHVNDNLFDHNDLKDLFTVSLDTKCNTHDLICSCEGTGETVSDETAQNVTAKTQKHFNGWTSAFEAQKIIDHNNKIFDKAKLNVIKKCLVGYKHFDSSKLAYIEDIVASKSIDDTGKDVTFAFVK